MPLAPRSHLATTSALTRGVSLAVSPGEMRQLVGELLLRPPHLEAQLPQPRALSITCHC